MKVKFQAGKLCNTIQEVTRHEQFGMPCPNRGKCTIKNHEVYSVNIVKKWVLFYSTNYFSMLRILYHSETMLVFQLNTKLVDLILCNYTTDKPEKETKKFLELLKNNLEN